jgi:hypothetical protein
MVDTDKGRQALSFETFAMRRWEENAFPYNLTDLPRKMLLFVLAWLPIKDVIRATGACKSLASTQFPKEFLDAYQIQASYPLNSSENCFSRTDLLECVHKTTLFQLKTGKISFDSLVGSDLLPILTSISAQNHLFLFSQRSDSIIFQWEIVNKQPFIIRQIPCDGKVLDIKLLPGKIGLICTKTSLIVHIFPWESTQLAQIQTISYSLREEAKSGTAFFYDKNSKIAAIINGWIYIFTGKLELLRYFRDTNWVTFPGWALQISPDLPYFALICLREVLIYDITSVRKLPVFQYETPFIERYKARTVTVSSEERRKCYLILLVWRGSDIGTLLANSKCVAREAADFAVCQNMLFVCQNDTSQIAKYSISPAGVHLMSVLPSSDCLSPPFLIAYENRLFLIGKQSGFPESTVISFYDHQGWKYYSVRLKNFDIGKVAFEGADKVLLTGECASNHVKITLVLNYWRTSAEPLKLKERARLARENELQKAKLPTAKAVRTMEFVFQLRHEEKKREKQAKIAREAAMSSRYWKNSERRSRSMQTMLLEDFSLL